MTKKISTQSTNAKPATCVQPTSDLIPTIIQDKNTGQVLMLGYSNKESLQKTRETGNVWFYSRSTQRLWMKGETSGNVLKVENTQGNLAQSTTTDTQPKIVFDCDRDTILIKAIPAGPTCHTGATSCFTNPTSKSVHVNTFQPEESLPGETFDISKNLAQLAPENPLQNVNTFKQLFAIIQDRKNTMPSNSYTASLFRKGTTKICAKIKEESQEVIQSATQETKQRLTEESVDLIYHLFTLLTQKGIPLSEIEQEILKRKNED